VSRVIQPGVCRHCGCTEGSPCSLCRLEHGDCAWSTRERLVCVGSPCIRAEGARVAAAKLANRKPPSRFTGMGFGAICEIKQREERNARRRGRARKTRVS
jgi:hypothetical protein